MSCDVSSSPFSGHGINNGSPFEDKQPTNEQVDLSAIADFNANFQGFDQGSVGPNLTYSNVSSPGFGLDQTLSADPSANFYPDFSTHPSSPYFQSIEPASTPFLPSPLRNQYLYRRSVSEPPNDAMLHHHQQQVTFHRDGHKLGAPNPKSSTYAPPAKKAKQSRTQSYRSSHHGPPPTQQDRYHLRRSHTQPNNRGPTSSPMGMMMRPPHPPHHMMPIPFDPMHGDQQYVSSRVCTPALEAVDPMLAAPQAPMLPHIGAAPPGGLPQTRNGTTLPKALVIKMGVGELRTLIQEAVQKAVEGLQAGKHSSATVPESDEADDLVVAGKSAGTEGNSKVEEDASMEE